MNILIPQLKKVKLYGYYPIFSENIEFNINDNLFLILGGNGLGKTTILQSIVYGIAGPAGENIEPKENKSRRWNRNYFKDRLDNSGNAVVEVVFNLGNNTIALKRGFNSDKIIEFTLDGKLVSNDKQKAEIEFEAFLQSEASYKTISDFYFVVHKLCYLSEKRENLAWDLEAQTRILMQIFSEEFAENRFRKRRADIKELDSKIRHKTVDINWLDNKIKLGLESNEPDGEQVKIKAARELPPSEVDELRINKLKEDLLNINDLIISKQDTYKKLKDRHALEVTHIEQLRETLAQNEYNFFFEQLNKIESNEAKLAIHKLIHYKLCPSCGTKSEELYRQAVEHLKDECCPLCGTSQSIDSQSAIPGIEAELVERLNSKLEIEKSIITIEKDLERHNVTLIDLNAEVNKVILNRQASVVFVDRSNNDANSHKEDLENLKKAYSNLINDRNELQIQFNKLRQELENEYKLFNEQNNVRIERLSEFYENYATEFLGIKCTLSQIDSNDRFLNLKLFVPSFNDKTRNTADSCSEAQRFFLDIAFRMALIQLISELSGYKGTFICETPESALDITYIDNVADMFEIFAIKNKNTLLMTSNIQSGGIAQTILSHVKQNERRALVLNLIEIGHLSDVQASEHGRELLEEQLKIIFGS